jgi:hypothetical protein
MKQQMYYFALTKGLHLLYCLKQGQIQRGLIGLLESPFGDFCQNRWKLSCNYPNTTTNEPCTYLSNHFRCRYIGNRLLDLLGTWPNSLGYQIETNTVANSFLYLMRILGRVWLIKIWLTFSVLQKNRQREPF